MSDTLEVKPVEEVKKEEKDKEPSDQIAGALSVFPGSPSKDQIEQWKGKYGEVFCSGFSETELFIFRPISRQEFVGLQVEAANSQVPLTPFDMEEKLVKTCILWSSVLGEKALTNKGGSMATLHEQIMAQSNFIAPQLAQQLVIKL
jgi:hypothetical protein